MTQTKKYDVTSGSTLRCQGWRQEALLRLLENVLSVGENPDELIVYAALGKAARNWASHDKIVETLKNMSEDETLLIQSGKPIGVVKTHNKAPLVIMANCNMVGQWAKAENFYDLQDKGLICWGGLTAGAWQYIGSQGVIQGTYEIFLRIAEQYFNNDLRGKFILSAGLGGMGGAQPLAGTMANATILVVEMDAERIEKRIENGYLQHRADTLDEALNLINIAKAKNEAISVGLLGNAADIYPEILQRGIIPDVVTDQTSAHDLIYGYIPTGMDLETVKQWRKEKPQELMQASLKSIKPHVEAMLAFQKAGAVVFDNGNLIRTQAQSAGVTNAFDIPIFTEAFLRPLFCQAIGPFRWIALSNDPNDIAVIDNYILEHFSNNASICNWINLAKQYVPFEGLPARIAWLGHKERGDLAVAVNEMVKDCRLSGPIAFSRDHLDSAAMAHPNIMTENLIDGSDAIADWPLIDAMMLCSSEADLVVVHSGGGGYSGYMTSAGVTVIADGSDAASERLNLAINNDTALGVMRYADAGYDIAKQAVKDGNINHFDLS
ncbi:urocanate hydratase [Pasteurella skyensis]|uniref:Urocanate hydratase n=1 Tax=Phocoenobacter skyensis TaxID=97481 RepID=A0AAJ6N932_9PAST|nr:urocanate hydratase [Pasteurella skyensis]MDP8162503.1 urocanate hydratase [Pasteurella skyensis]MDP8172468.1 urocanate hydratase [Pasteurella skyensis]MDP8177493.1 urocanate hydratase [Pasteurella skyensis]MDP8178723.1 urocanate hydratase [Pasteurella skyensis]MDP8182987.1 urocanate hydratase [Pasteurella skyensis]